MLHRLLQSLRRLQPPPEENQPKTAHNTFFLILYEMGLEDKDVRRIMGVTQEAIRSTRYRILTPKGMSVARNQQNTKK